MKVTDDELTSVLRPLLEDTNHSLIPYARFLELFSSPRCSMFFFPLIVFEKQTGCQIVSTHSSLYEHGALLCLTACQTQAVLDLSGGNDVTITVQCF